MRHLIFTLFIVSATIGCSTKSGVIPIGKDTYMITMESATGFSTGAAVKPKVYAEGVEFCKQQQKVFQPISDNVVDGIAGRSYASAEVQFRCLVESDPEVGRPTMKPVANVRVESISKEKKVVQVQDSNDFYGELKKLKELLDIGAITQDEFDIQKRKILSR